MRGVEAAIPGRLFPCSASAISVCILLVDRSKRRKRCVNVVLGRLRVIGRIASTTTARPGMRSLCCPAGWSCAVVTFPER
jgi:hypothetical protein